MYFFNFIDFFLFFFFYWGDYYSNLVFFLFFMACGGECGSNDLSYMNPSVNLKVYIDNVSQEAALKESIDKIILNC